MSIFSLYSQGILTARDAWAYNFSRAAVVQNMESMIGSYNDQLTRFGTWVQENKLKGTPEDVEKFINRDPSKISWTRGLKSDLRKASPARRDEQRLAPSMYRPYCKQWLYLSRRFNEYIFQIPKLFPTAEHKNVVISMNASDARKPFAAIIIDVIPNYALSDPGQCFPLYYYEQADDNDLLFTDSEVMDGYRRHHAITDATFIRYEEAYGDITKDDIFYYVYGLLHSPIYRRRYAADLKKMIPRIPLAADFWGFSEAGRELAAWHLDYEEVDPWSLEEIVTGTEDYRVEKMRFAKDGSAVDKTKILYNHQLALAGIPQEAYRYEVNGKSAIEWIMDRYQVKADRDSGIVNDPNAWALEHGDPRYIVDLIGRIVSVSMATVQIVERLPKLELLTEGPDEQGALAASSS